MPKRLKRCNSSIALTGKIYSKYAGKAIPSSDGPKIMPANISPTTDGCPSFLNTKPNIRVENTMIISCIKKCDMGDSRLSLRVFINPENESFSGMNSGFWAVLGSNRTPICVI